MVSKKLQATWKTSILLVIGVIAFLIYLYLFNVDVPLIVETLQRINVSIYILSALLVFVETLFYTLSWWSLLDFLSIKLSVVTAYLYVWYGTYIDIIVPTGSIGGEASKLYLVTREKSGTSGKVIATIVTQRLMATGTIMTSLILGIGILSIEGKTGGLPFKLTLFFAATTILSLALLALPCLKETWTLTIINIATRFVNYVSGGRWNLTKIKEDVTKAVRMFHDSMEEFRHAPKTVSTSMLLVVLSWLSNISIAYLVLFALNFPVEWSVILITWPIVTVLPMHGLPEIAMTTIYTLLGVPPEIGVTATILTRILTFWLRLFIGFAAQQWLEIRTIKASATTETGKTQVWSSSTLKD